MYYLSCWGANTHHVIVATCGFYNFLTPPCDTNEHGIWTWFKNDECFMLMDKRYVYTSLITAGYLLYDLNIQFNYVGGKDALAYQVLFHHIIGTTGIIAGLIAGYGATGLGNLTCLAEVSTIILNYRSMYDKD